MTDGTTARAAMLAALEPSLGPELIKVFDELLPDQRWRDAIRIEQWTRPEVQAAVAAHSPNRRHLHEALVELLGEVHAGTLMEYLVPAPWSVLVRLGVPVAALAAVSHAA
jgi:hypothetical protein